LDLGRVLAFKGVVMIVTKWPCEAKREAMSHRGIMCPAAKYGMKYSLSGLSIVVVELNYFFSSFAYKFWSFYTGNCCVCEYVIVSYYVNF
jgi:hypothetical protein